MKRIAVLPLILALFTSSFAIAQTSGMKNMEDKNMNMQKCMDMKGMQGMDEQKCKGMMQNADEKHAAKSANAMTYKAIAVVKAVDAPNGKVTLNHEAVKSLNWPAMTMSFLVKDKMLLDKLTVGKKVSVEFQKQGSDYVVTSVKS